MRRALAVPLLVSGLIACYARTPVDQTPPPNGHAVKDTLPASLARRLSEAADGYRDGKDKWIVADRKARKGNHKVLGIFSTFDEADFVAKRAGGDFGAFGPYRTPAEDYQIPAGERVAEVIVRYVNGEQKRYSSDSVDALFWGLPAFDKFVVPYLSAVSSAEYAAEQREFYRRNQSELANTETVTHKKGSF
ncbi:MAG TPA: hypothetical protein VFU40_12665 [Gemmatimonadales bacterium]|nr:hypothetical protein [Gemmatimonadales bacterium]